jgi:sugar phosphate isomerase/epimerase
MSRINHQDILIGTMASMSSGPGYIEQVIEHGFESFEPNTGKVGDLNLKEYAKKVLDICGDQAKINCIGLYANPLQDPQAAADWETMIRSAKYFGATVVSGFAGAVEDKPVDQNMPKFKEVFGKLAKIAKDEGVKIAFENCDMGGTWNAPRWNIAHSPRAWEMMFNEIPDDTIGLEWEPCHQMYSFVEPIRQLRKYASRVYHIHGKDATVNHDVIEDYGIRSGMDIVWHRTPGFGDTNWADVITILRKAGFQGSIDIEGWHDPVYNGELEMTGQVYALDYLRSCRGGDYVENPK